MTNARLFSLKLDAPRAQALDRIFSANGVLAQNMQGYRVRAAQREMAGAIAAAMHGHPVNRHETSAGSTLCARYSGAAPRACNAPLRCNAQRPRQLCVSLLFAAH